MNKKSIQNFGWAVLHTIWTTGAFLFTSILLVGVPIGYFASESVYEWLSTPVGIFTLGAVVYTIATAIAISPLLSRRMDWKALAHKLGLTKPHARMVIWALGAWVLYFLSTAVVSVVLQYLPGLNLSQKQDIGFTSLSGSWEYILAFLTLVVVAPVFEELLFRGFLFGRIRERSGFWLSAIFTSLAFALLHGQLNVGIDVFILSMFLCYLREKRQSIVPGIFVHALKNGLAYALLFILPLFGIRLV